MKKEKGVIRKFFVILAVCIFICGCDFMSPRRTAGPETAPRRPSVKGPLLARVDEWAIGVDDFKERLGALKPLYPDADLDDPDNQKRILQELVNREILARVAESQGLDDTTDVRETLEDFKSTLLVEKMNERMSQEITVTDAEIRNFYDSNKLIFREPEERKIRELVVSTEDRAKDILIRLLQGENFTSLARTYSIAASRNKGGDLGYLAVEPKEKFRKFWEEAFTKEKGETSGYFRGPDGYYILKVEDVRGGKEKLLIDVREEIKEHLRREKIKKKRDDLIYSAKQKMNVVINVEYLE
ncbi:MAG: peptidyl-prolyl cis-trans isomerase [Candidatus Omnitrophota bacterium]|nr:MAG: peptidyl-prolyl cis-trans isomerase [Candidatus Omnitrophota bacterium]